MSKLDGVLIFLLGIPVTLMAWISMSEAEGYYMSPAINQGFPMGIAFIALIGAMGLTMLMVGLFIIHINRNN
tara:strand:+ start:215 stop:430 length:216 start_codon:yes stop_codon:yes gene_type:complete